MKKVLKRVTFVTERQKKLFTDTNPEAARFRCQVKLHINGLPIRPIVSFINSPSYRVAKEVSKLLRHL